MFCIFSSAVRLILFVVCLVWGVGGIYQSMQSTYTVSCHPSVYDSYVTPLSRSSTIWPNANFCYSSVSSWSDLLYWENMCTPRTFLSGFVTTNMFRSEGMFPTLCTRLCIHWVDRSFSRHMAPSLCGQMVFLISMWMEGGVADRILGRFSVIRHMDLLFWIAVYLLPLVIVFILYFFCTVPRLWSRA